MTLTKAQDGPDAGCRRRPGLRCIVPRADQISEGEAMPEILVWLGYELIRPEGEKDVRPDQR